MPNLSIVMIVKNEAHCLGDCLDSVRAIADEIVIADTGSTDDTVAIAQRYNAHIIHIPWKNDFAWARNQSLAAATGDWLLHMDADEVLDPAGARRIREIVDADGEDTDSVELVLANYCNDTRAWRWQAASPDDPMARGYAGYIPAPLLRLFRNHRGYQYREPVHENITESVVERGGIIRSEPIIIHHYGYDGPRSDEKSRIYLDIAKHKVEERPHDPKAWLDLAEPAFASDDAALAETACRKAIALAPIDVGANTMLANLLLNRGDLDEARAILESLQQAGIDLPHIGTALGAIAYKQGRLEEARVQLERVLERHPQSIQAILYLARVHDISGEFTQARQCLQCALSLAPTLTELRARLQAHAIRSEGESLLQKGNPAAALHKQVEALKLDHEDPLIHNNIGHLLTALNHPEKAQESFIRAQQLSTRACSSIQSTSSISSSP